MNTQPEATELAEVLESYRMPSMDARVLAAAELRRQHAECNDLARQLNESNERNGRLKAQRDALLGLLKEARKIAPASSSRNLAKDWDQRTTAAIKAVEGENHAKNL